VGYWEGGGKSDEWFTPPHVFEALGERFDLDVAAPSRCAVPARMSFSTGGLTNPWWGFVWMNPPFGGRNGLEPWLVKFFEHGNGIALTPDRTSAPWFQRACERADAILFTPKLRFLRADGSEGASPSNGTALLAAGGRAVRALMRSRDAGLGVMVVPF
jgi:hypothetical protein